MKKLCAYCENPINGRTDKKFCGTTCKNAYNNQMRKETQRITREIDGFLHRNREILATLMGKSRKETFDKLILDRTGFKYEYHTGTYRNKEGKIYYIVYDYAWMPFSDMKILVIQKQKNA